MKLQVTESVQNLALYLVQAVAYAEISEGGGFGAKNTIALSSPGNGQKLPKLGLHSKIKCFGLKNIL